ncbi:hypothetical protein THIX_60263 [Thiomonas sp. X19]|nr:hypothetical protein THIX_60263 [Thiomonas sp. X19]
MNFMRVLANTSSTANRFDRAGFQVLLWDDLVTGATDPHQTAANIASEIQLVAVGREPIHRHRWSRAMCPTCLS